MSMKIHNIMREVKISYIENYKALLRELSTEVCGKQTQYYQNVCSSQIKKQVQWNPNQNLAGFYESNKKQWQVHSKISKKIWRIYNS